MSGQMPWGAVAFMMAVYTFLGACFMGGVIDVDPSAQLIPIADPSSVQYSGGYRRSHQFHLEYRHVQYPRSA